MPRISQTGSNITLYNKDIAAGIIDTLPIITDNANGTINVSSCQALLYSNANRQGGLNQYVIPSITNQVLSVDVTSYLVVDYNSGSPQYQVLSAAQVELINESTIIPVFTLYNEGDVLVHVINWDELGQGMSNKIHARLVKTNRFARQSGLLLGTSLDTNRRVNITAGTVWTGAVSHNVNSFSSGTSGHRWYFWQKTGPSTWSRSVVTDGTGTYNNSHYNTEAGAFVALTTGMPYTVNWIYRDLDIQSHASYVLGTIGYGTLSAARASQPREDLPPEFAIHSILVGRVISRLNETIAVEVDPAYPPFERFVSTGESFAPSFGEIFGCPHTGSFPVLASIPPSTYNPVLAGDRIIAGIQTGITAITKNTATGLTLNLGASVSNGVVSRISNLVVGSGYGADGTYEGITTTGGAGTGCIVDITVENGKVKYVRINDGGSGYAASNVLSITGGTATFTVEQIRTGAIQSVTVNNGGTGYIVGQCVSISTGNKNAIVRITNVVGGVVQAGGATLVRRGTGYTGGAVNQATTVISGMLITAAGVYKVDSTISFSDSTSVAHLIKGTVTRVSGSRAYRQENGNFIRTISSTNVGSAGFSALIDTSLGDFVFYEFENGHSSSTSLTLDSFEWVMFKA